MARPKKLIDPDMVEKLASAGCTAEQIGAILECNERTIQRRFAALLKRGRERRNGKLMVRLYSRAMNGSDAIAIFLAKNWLGMSDRPGVVVSVQQNAAATPGSLFPVTEEVKAKIVKMTNEIRAEAERERARHQNGDRP